MYKSRKIPEKLYMQIKGSIPILCVDVLVKTDTGVLLEVRDHWPAKNKAWVIGGRVYYGESLEHAIERKVKDELGLNVKIIKQVGIYSTVFSKGGNTHTVNVVYLVEKTGGKLRPNNEYRRLIYVDKIESNLHPFIKRALSDSRVFDEKKTNKRYSNKNFFADW